MLDIWDLESEVYRREVPCTVDPKCVIQGRSNRIRGLKVVGLRYIGISSAVNPEWTGLGFGKTPFYDLGNRCFALLSFL